VKRNVNVVSIIFFPQKKNGQDDFHRVVWMIPLFSGYTQERYWWEIWMLLRRTLILAFGTIFAEAPLQQGQSFVIINGIILFIHILGSPFRETEMNLMESASLVVLIVLSTLVLDAPVNLPLTNSVFVLLILSITFAIFAIIVLIYEWDQVMRFFISLGSLFPWVCCACNMCEKSRREKRANLMDEIKALKTQRALKKLGHQESKLELIHQMAGMGPSNVQMENLSGAAGEQTPKARAITQIESPSKIDPNVDNSERRLLSPSIADPKERADSRFGDSDPGSPSHRALLSTHSPTDEQDVERT